MLLKKKDILVSESFILERCIQKRKRKLEQKEKEGRVARRDLLYSFVSFSLEEMIIEKKGYKFFS